MRAVTLDEVHFKNERLKLRLDHDPLDVINVPNHLPGLFGMSGVIDKVGVDAVPQVDRFSDVNDFVVGVLHQVTAGLLRQGGEGAADFFVDFNHSDRELNGGMLFIPRRVVNF